MADSDLDSSFEIIEDSDSHQMEDVRTEETDSATIDEEAEYIGEEVTLDDTQDEDSPSSGAEDASAVQKRRKLFDLKRYRTKMGRWKRRRLYKASRKPLKSLASSMSTNYDSWTHEPSFEKLVEELPEEAFQERTVARRLTKEHIASSASRAFENGWGLISFWLCHVPILLVMVPFYCPVLVFIYLSLLYLFLSS
ncbi:hypothetical protein QR680_010835 [Steinernema hermaphroditum]|uniref:Transmembrane protein n=1 Tax=Steinernema hermaphroditum TaxID=289476 RepID=A0AA39MCC3_9BILA|nr:hypothetical protein QR680_010835 [Steinernema hermaphroditum]